MPARTGRGRQRKGRAFELQIIKDLWAALGKAVPWNKYSRPDDGAKPPDAFAEFHLECKKQEKLNIWGALEQSQREAAAAGKSPVVVFSRSRAPLYVALPYESWKELVLRGKHGKEESS